MTSTVGKNDVEIILQYWIRIFHSSSILIIPNEIYKTIVLYIDVFILSICAHNNPSNILKFNLLSPNINPKLLVNIGKDLGIGLNSKNIKVYNKTGDEIINYNNILNNDTIYLSNGAVLKDENPLFHICILGECSDKSDVTLKYIRPQFVPDYDPTIDDTYRKWVHVDGSHVLIDILDTAGQEDFQVLRKSWMSNKDGFVFLFDITNSKSFKELESYHEIMYQLYEDCPPPIILCGSKYEIQLNRQISEEKAKQFAKKWNCCDYIQVSSKTGYNINYLFTTLIRYILAPLVKNEMPIHTMQQSDKKKCKCLVM